MCRHVRLKPRPLLFQWPSSLKWGRETLSRKEQNRDYMKVSPKTQSSTIVPRKETNSRQTRWTWPEPRASLRTHKTMKRRIKRCTAAQRFWMCRISALMKTIVVRNGKGAIGASGITAFHHYRPISELIPSPALRFWYNWKKAFRGPLIIAPTVHSQATSSRWWSCVRTTKDEEKRRRPVKKSSV